MDRAPKFDPLPLLAIADLKISPWAAGAWRWSAESVAAAPAIALTEVAPSYELIL